MRVSYLLGRLCFVNDVRNFSFLLKPHFSQIKIIHYLYRKENSKNPMITMKSTLILLICLISSLSYAGIPNLGHSISNLNNPIVVGEEVYFQSNVIRYAGCNSSFGILVDFGPFADEQELFVNVGSSMADFNTILGPIVFNMPFSGDIEQSILNTTCSTYVATLAINVLPERSSIPTLSQWGLIIIGFFLMIFGIVTLRKQKLQKQNVQYF